MQILSDSQFGYTPNLNEFKICFVRRVFISSYEIILYKF